MMGVARLGSAAGRFELPFACTIDDLRSPTDSLATVGAVVGGAIDLIGADVPSLAPATLLAGLAWW
jgi:hypothetical protein